MGKGFGIAAIIVVLISFWIPVIGVFTTAFAMVIAAIGALAGDRVYSTVTAIVGAVSIFLFSPSVWIALTSPDDAGKTALFSLIVGSLALPFVAMIANATGKVALGKQGGTQQ